MAKDDNDGLTAFEREMLRVQREKLVEMRRANDLKESEKEAAAPKSIDEEAKAHLRRARGQDRPLPPTETVPCLSPITRSTFDAELQLDSDGRMTVVQLVNYVRPKGWDVLKKDGGICTNEAMLAKNPEDSTGYTKKAQWEQHKAFYVRDWSEIGPTADGRRELPDFWRVKKVTASAAE